MTLRLVGEARQAAIRRDLMLGAGMLAAFGVIVAATSWTIESTARSSRVAAIAIAAATVAVDACLTVALRRGPSRMHLLAFPAVLCAAQVSLAVATQGITPNYAVFFALAIVYVGFTQRPAVVPVAIAITAPCWLIGQEQLSPPVWIHLGAAITMWGLIGGALATRGEAERGRATELLERANTDELTGLATRALLLDSISRELRSSSRPAGAVIVLDLDNFKGVNDMYGHAAGDEALIAAAQRIMDAFRPDDTCARLAGDEFAVLIRHVDLDHAAEAARRLAESLAAPVVLSRGPTTVTASLGVAHLDDATDADTALQNADLAMYQAKKTGRNQVAVFAHEMREQRAARLQLETDLRAALERDEFELHYQPVVHLHSRGVVGVEALLRWHHPQRGLLQPRDFLNAAEEIGVIIALGDWIRDQACRQAMRWQPADPTRALSLAINVSAPEIVAADFVDRVEAVLTHTGLAGRLLILEITERLVVSDAPVVRRRLHDLRRLGVRIAIDDFGTGYSSLAYLRELPVDILKIDQNFVKPLDVDPRARALLRAILAVADALGLDVIAEGVETQHQIDMLSSLGCNVAQGYAFARPVPPDGILALLEQNQRRPTHTPDANQPR